MESCGWSWYALGGHPPAGRREVRVWFWQAIARGASSEKAAVEAGILPSIGVRWFRRWRHVASHLRAGVRALLSFEEREEIAVLRAGGLGFVNPRQLGRAPSTGSRESQRNAAIGRGRVEYRASTAQRHAERRAQRPKPGKLATNQRSRGPMCRIAFGDGAATRRRRRGSRLRGAGDVRDRGRIAVGDSAGARSRSPGASAWLPDDESMRGADEAIYQSLYIQGRGALRRELTACLRTGRALRAPRNRASKATAAS